MALFDLGLGKVLEDYLVCMVFGGGGVLEVLALWEVCMAYSFKNHLSRVWMGLSL